MTAVVLLGDIVSATTQGLELTRRESGELKPAFLDVLGERPEDAGCVLAVHPAWSWRVTRTYRQLLVEVLSGGQG